MVTSVVIPTYWARKKDDPWQEGDAVYDHPTYIDADDTLGRTLESMKLLTDKNFKLVIPICPTADEIEDEAEKRVRKIIEEADLPIETYIFTQKNLREIKALLKSDGLDTKALDLLNLKGYSNVRNICIYTSFVLSSDVTILIDDDELFEKPNWIEMAKEHIGKRMYGKSIYGVAGYYLNKYDEFYDDVDIVPWMTYWNRFGSKTKAFDKIIGCDPRMKVTPFAFGGAMIIHKNMFQIVPFDPKVTRGEDIDYLVNAKMFGFDFYLDNQLSIKHLPPKKNHPVWKRFREDIYRFLYEQAKIRSQYEVNTMNRITAEDFDPYPGDFLKDDLEDKIFKTNILLALEYLSDGNIEGCRESIRNIYLSKYEAIPHFDPFTEYRATQKAWSKLIQATRDNRHALRKVMESNNLSRVYAEIDQSRYQACTNEDKIKMYKKLRGFKELSDDELGILSELSVVKAFNEDEIVFQEGDTEISLMVVIHGCVRIVKHDSMNDEIPLGKVCSNGIIGETFLLKEKYDSTAVADEFVEMLILKKEAVKNLIEENPTLGNKLLYLFLDKMYYKLNSTNILYKEKIEQEQDISDK